MPSIPPASRLSTKKHSTPSSTTAQAIRSSPLGRFRQNTADRRMTKMGAVNCRTMVLAAVVSLLATVNRLLVPQMHTAPTRIQRLNFGRCRVARR